MFHTCSEEDNLVFQRQVREVWDPLGPLYQCEKLLVSCMANIGDRIISLKEEQEFQVSEINNYHLGFLQTLFLDPGHTSFSLKCLEIHSNGIQDFSLQESFSPKLAKQVLYC